MDKGVALLAAGLMGASGWYLYTHADHKPRDTIPDFAGERQDHDQRSIGEKRASGTITDRSDRAIMSLDKKNNNYTTAEKGPANHAANKEEEEEEHDTYYWNQKDGKARDLLLDRFRDVEHSKNNNTSSNNQTSS